MARDLEWRVNHLGFAVAGVTPSGEQATALAEQERPDLVLMDIACKARWTASPPPTTSAPSCTSRWCSSPRMPTTRRCARASVTEAFGYIIKPASERELRVVIEMALYKHARAAAPAARAAGPRSEKMDAIGQLARRHRHDFNKS